MTTTRVAEGDGASIWALRTQSRPTYPQRYEVRASSGALELWDCNVAIRALHAITGIDDPVATTALWAAADDDDPRIVRLALEMLARRQVTDLVPRLMARLRGGVASAFVAAALNALATVGSPAGLDLVDDLLRLTGDRYEEEHPGWGRGSWGSAIHRVIVSLDADDQVRAVLDDALAGADAGARAAAMAESGRWFGEAGGLAPERRTAWTAPEHVDRVVDVVLHDGAAPVRSAARWALAALPADHTVDPLVRALRGENEPVRVAAAEALAGLSW